MFAISSLDVLRPPDIPMEDGAKSVGNQPTTPATSWLRTPSTDSAGGASARGPDTATNPRRGVGPIFSYDDMYETITKGAVDDHFEAELVIMRIGACAYEHGPYRSAPWAHIFRSC